MKRVYNFGAGPAMLPESVLRRAQEEMLDWRGTGMSLMEIGHRSDCFQNFLYELQKKLIKIIGIPSNYKLLFLSGGGQGQFASIPMNLLGSHKKADYLHSGHWSGLAMEEAKKHAVINSIADCKQYNFYSFPSFEEWKLDKKAAYFYYCPNETLVGLQIKELPEIEVPIVADLTSCIVAEPLNISQFAVAFAATQKNLGQAGVTLVIVREDCLGRALPLTPDIWNYTKQAENNSSANTPPVYAIYFVDLVADWILEQGGVEKLGEVNHRKAQALYHFIDQSHFYHNAVDQRYRSITNIIFTLPSEAQTKNFLKEAEAAQFVNLKGHRKIGGARISLFNAVTEKMVAELIDFMKVFMNRH